MIYDKKQGRFVDLCMEPYFRDYEVAITTNGIILLLQNGSVISSADMERFQPEPITVYDKKTGHSITVENHPYFKDYEVAIANDVILLLQYGTVVASANPELYGIKQKKLKELEGAGLSLSEQAVYRYIFSYILQHRYAPTYEEILKNCKIHSKSTISLHIKKMLTLGLLESDAPGMARALRLPMPA